MWEVSGGRISLLPLCEPVGLWAGFGLSEAAPNLRVLVRPVRFMPKV